MTDRYLGMDFTGLSFVEEQKLKGFFHKFTEEYYSEYKIGHIIFATYAAVPTYINPDLLYKIWMNFKDYYWRENAEKIHLVAVVDLINSSFCEEIGPKLYRINNGVRKVLNDWLRNENTRNTKKLFSENDIAHFINAELKHYQKDYNLWGGEEYVFDQGLNADLLVYPDRAMEKIKQVLYQAKSDTEKLLAFNLLVDAKKKISTEIDYDEISELGKGWKEYLLGKPTKLLKRLEHMENSFLRDEPNSPYSMEITIPTEIVKEEIARKKKKRVYGVFVGVDEYQFMPPTEGCVKDTTSFHDVLKDNIDKKKNKIDFKLLVNKNAAYDNIKDCLEELKNLDDGDTFVFYYSGHGYDGIEGKGRVPLFYDATPDFSNKSESYIDNVMHQGILEKDILEIIKEKSIHCILIFDYSNMPTENRRHKLYENELKEDNDLKGSLVVFDRVNSKEDVYDRNGRFTSILLSILGGGGFHMTYNEIHDKIRINILQQNSRNARKNIPNITAFPPDASQLKFLNNTENIYDNLEIYYNKNRKKWEVNAGFNKGINSSIDLVPTILEADIDGKKIKWQVDKSYMDYASLTDFEGDTNRKIKARLLQNSLRKILFFIDDKESFEGSTRQELKNYLQRRAVPLVEITEIKLEAKYIISHNDFLGFFVYDPLFGESLSIISLQRNMEEFITHLEYLAHWEGLLQYSNINSKLNPDHFKWSLSLNNGLMVQEFFNLSNIDINVKKDYGRKQISKQSFAEDSEDMEVSCTVTFKDSSSNEELKEEFILGKINGDNPGINFELIKGMENEDFGLSMLILDDNLSIEEMPATYIYKGNQAVRGINYDYVNTVRSKLKKNKQLYLKIFLSHQKINGGAFLQEGTNKDIRQKDASMIFDASETDWLSYTIPINVVLEEGNDMEKPISKNIKNIGPLNVERQKVLFFTIMSKGNSLVETEINFTEIHSEVDFDINIENFVIAINRGVNLPAFSYSLLDESPRILHLFVEGDKKGIQLKNSEGKFIKVPAAALDNLFSLFEGVIDCVILDGCYEEEQADAISNHIPFIIGIEADANEDGKKSFNTYFYKSLEVGGTDFMRAYESGISAAKIFDTFIYNIHLILGGNSHHSKNPVPE